MYKPDKLEPGQIWLNSVNDPLLVVQPSDRSNVSIVVLRGYIVGKSHIPVVINYIENGDQRHWEYVGMLGDKENE